MFVLVCMLATCREGRLLFKSHPHPQSQNESFYRQREGATCRNSTVSSDSHLEIGHLWSDQHHLAEVQFIFSLLPFPWGHFLELWQLMSWLRSGHDVVNFSLYGSFGVYKTAYRRWLRIFSVALEKELEVLDFAYVLNYLVFLDYFPLFLHFLTSLIKFILCLKFFEDRRQVEDMVGEEA